jgi:class 3 adenylate cyclase/TolB-like protein/Tfp pilus assembly protein PilF
LKSNENELVAIMFADIANYTAIMQQSETKAKTYLDAFQFHLKRIVPKYDGQIVNTYGDGCLVKFYSAEASLKAARQIQIEFLAKDLDLPVRIGIHLGDVFIKDGNIYGNNVNIASRIESFAISGSILFSEEVHSQITNKDDFIVTDLGKVKFKNDQKTRSIYALGGDVLKIPKRSELKGKGKLAKSKVLHLAIYPIIVLLLLLGYFTKFQNANDTAAYTKNSIAVLPLVNLSSIEENLDYYSDGLTIEIIDELAKISSFNITPFTQSVFYKHLNKKDIDIAKELAVNFIVSGSVRLYHNKQIKLSIWLFDPYTKKRIWNQTFEDKLGNAQMFQLEIAKQIADKLEIELSTREESSLEKLNTIDGGAFKLFLKAKSEMDKFTEPGFSKAREFLDKAIEIDSNYAQAYTLKAWSILLSSDPMVNPKASIYHNNLKEGERLLNRSIKLRPDYSDNYVVRSGYAVYANNKIKDAIDDINLAIKLKSWPRVPTNYCTCQMIISMISGHRFEKAAEILRITKKIDPGNIFQSYDEANLYLAQGNFKEAEYFYRQAYENFPNEYFRTHLAISLYHQKRYEDVIDLFAEGKVKGEIELTLSHAYLSNAYYEMGDIKNADYHLNRITERKPWGNINLYLSIVYLGRKEYDLAMSYFEKAYEMNEIGLAVASSVYPIFNNISQYEKYQEIRTKMQFEN